MKKNFLLALLGCLALVFASCKKTDVEPKSERPIASQFTLSVEKVMPTRTQAADASMRYVMEIYAKANPTATDAAEQHIEQNSGTFDVVLKEGVTYTFLFWADYGTLNDTESKNDYDVRDLKVAKIRQQPSKAAWAGCVSFTKGSETESDYTVKLTHAVAQVNFVQSENFTQENNTLEVDFPQTYSLNVVDGSTKEITNSGSSAPKTYSFTTTGKNQKDQTIGTSYIIAKSLTAPNDAKTVLNLTTNLNNGETRHSISNVPFARNYRTLIKGAYSNLYGCNATISCDQQWGDPDNEITIPKPNEMKFTVRIPDDDKRFSCPFSNEGRTPADITITVDWGDGQKNTILGNTKLDFGDAFDHTYTGAGDYTITITSSQTNPTQKQIPLFIPGLYRTHVDTNQTKIIRMDTPLLNMDRTSFSSYFINCSSLVSVPQGLFDKNTQATNFQSCFEGCSSLTSLPQGLFDKNTQATNFQSCFEGCTSLTSLPQGLFDKNTRARDFSYCFDSCTSLVLNPKIFCAKPSQSERYEWFNDKDMNFIRCFYNVGTALDDDDVSRSVAPDLWKYKIGNSSFWTFNLCYTNCKANWSETGTPNTSWK